jgi:hypothetical protein
MIIRSQTPMHKIGLFFGQSKDYCRSQRTREMNNECLEGDRLDCCDRLVFSPFILFVCSLFWPIYVLGLP